MSNLSSLHKRITHHWVRSAAKITQDDIKTWRKGLDQLERKFRSIPGENTPEALRKYQEVKKEASEFGHALERWLNKVFDSRYTQVAEKIHTLFLRNKGALQDGKGVFPIDMGQNPAPQKLGKYGHDYHFGIFRKPVERILGRVSEFLDAYAGLVDVPDAPYTLNVSGVQVVVYYEGEAATGDRHKENREVFIRNLKTIFDRIRHAGFGKALEGLTVGLKYKIDTPVLANGVYNPETDQLDIFPLGMSQDPKKFGGTLIHEIGHRFYYKALPQKARKHWENMLRKNVLAPLNQKELRDYYTHFFKKAPDEPRKVHYLIDQEVSDFERNLKYKALNDYVKKKRLKWLPSRILQNILSLDGMEFPVESITPYGDSSPIEGFAEAFKLYVNQGPRALKPWTRQFFERVVQNRKTAQRVALRAFRERHGYEYEGVEKTTLEDFEFYA